MFQSCALENRIAGFTLIESLVALAIVAIALSSIGALIASTIRTTRAIEGKLDRLAATRTVLGALPDRDQIAPGAFSGDVAGHNWRLDVSAFASKDIALQPSAPWVTQLVVVTVQSPTAGAMQISTVRLRRRDAQ